MSDPEDDRPPPPKIHQIIVRDSTAARKRLATDQVRFHRQLGELVRWWSLLHDDLVMVFRVVTGCEFWLAYAMWHAIKSDLVQRQMLSAAIAASRDRILMFPASDSEQYKVPIYEELIWIINRITEFSHKRNDFVHAPIVFFLDLNADEFEAQIGDRSGDPRAERLKGRELFQYCAWCIDFTKRMRGHIAAVLPCLRKPGPLPERPKLPPLSQFPTRKEGTRRRTRKAPPRRPKPSPE